MTEQQRILFVDITYLVTDALERERLVAGETDASAP